MTLALFLLQTVQVDGLQAGEAVEVLAPEDAPALGLDGLVDGRVVDAFSGRPLAGATVETWSEENDRVHGGLHRVGEASSGLDGRFRVASSEQAAKVRVQAPGHLTLSATLRDLAEPLELFPAQAEPMRVRIVDSAQRPIPGARLTSTYSCAHDVPAFDVTTDALGVAQLPTYGLQRDVPTLRLRAPGFAARKYLDGRPALTARGEPWTVHLPRRPSCVLRVLGPDGEPLAHAPLSVLDHGDEQFVRTDAEGLAGLPSRYGRGELMVQDVTRRIAEPGFTLDAGAPGEPCTVRLGSRHWPEATPLARLRLSLSGDLPADGPAPPVVLLHADGWFRSFGAGRDPGEPLEFPAGPARLVLGGDFEEFERQVLELELAPDAEHALTLELRRAARVELILPENTHHAWIESEDQSVMDPAPGAHFVPLGRPLRAFARNERATHWLELSAVQGGEVIDLSGEETRIEQEPARAMTSQHVIVAGSEELPDRQPVLTSAPPGARLVPLDVPRHYRVEGPAGTVYLLRWRAGGNGRFAGTGYRAVLGEGPETRTLTPLPLAQLEIDSNVPLTPLTGEALDLSALHPGLLRLVLRTEDGERVGLRLNLEPGERRQLLVHLAP